ncbi:MAG: hypothetical protein WA060_02585 [Minisyncoccia bacterium]
MEQETKTICEKKCESFNSGGCGEGAVYVLGFIGAVVYYIQHADTFLIGVTGILKAFVWPALVVYKLFVYFGF